MSLIALLALAGCSQGDPVLADLEGTVSDAAADDEPVGDAWVVVDTRAELIATRTGADGRYAIPELPADEALTITFAAPGRVALTYQGLFLEDLEGPLDVRGLGYVDPMAYEPETWAVSGTITGAPAGSYLLLYGETEYHGYVVVEDQQPVPYEFETRVWGDSYTFSAVAIGADGVTTLGAGVATVTGPGNADLTVSTDLGTLTVTTDRPLVDGVPLAALDQEYCTSLGYTHPAEAWGVVTGYTDACADLDDGFSFTLTWLADGVDSRVDLYLAEDIEGGSASWASVPVPQGASTLEVDALDAPRLHARGTFGTGRSIGWDPVVGATDYLVVVDDGSVATWHLVPLHGAHVEFPRLPESVPEGTITGRYWNLDARYAVFDGDALDPAEPYLVSISAGGEVTW